MAKPALLWLSMLSAFLALSMLSQRNPRNLTPILPAIALLATLGLRAYRRPITIAIGVAWIAVLALFFGDRLFAGDTATDILGAIVHRKPDWDKLPGDTPAGAMRLLKRC